MSHNVAEQELWGCARHAQFEKTCCQTCEVLVTKGDRLRIAEHTGQQEFWERRAPTDPVYLQQDDDPNWLKWVFAPDGTRPILRRRTAGDCGFLETAGCTLPVDVRPLVCRLYPFTYTERGIDGVSDGCPKEVIPPGSTILKVLDMNRAEADEWHALLYAELRSGERCDETRIDIRPA